MARKYSGVKIHSATLSNYSAFSTDTNSIYSKEGVGVKTLPREFKKFRLPQISDSISVIFLLAFLLGGCGGLTLDSNWRDREIIVDGIHDEWEGGLTYIEKEHVSVGLLNDDEYMYICLVTRDRDIRRRVIQSGFTLWFDPDGSKDKTFGIRYPLGMIEMGRRMRGRGEGRDDETLRENFAESLREIEILGPDKDDRRRLSVAEVTGIEIRIRISNEMLVYETKVPLIQNDQHPYAIGAGSGQLIGVGLETAKFDREAMRERMAGGPGGGRRPGGGMGGGGRGGMGGGRRGSGRPQIPEQFKLWASVQLASENFAVRQ